MQEDQKTQKTAVTAPVDSPHPSYGAPGIPEEGDEINLLDLFIVLLKYKGMIFGVVIMAGILAVVISLLLPNIYRSECTISPTTQEKGSGALSSLGGFGAMIASEIGITATGSLDQFNVVLKSNDLSYSIIRKYNLMPILFENKWDAANNRWKRKPPTYEDAYKEIHELLTIMPDKKQNVMKLSFELKDPKLAQTILNYYIVGLSEFLRRQSLEDAAAQQVQLSQQLAKTIDPLLKNRLYELIARQIEKETLAKVQKYYSFNIIDPALVPEKKFKPKRALIGILTVVVAFFSAVFLAFFREYMHNVKKNDPERLKDLRKYLKFRNS